MEASLWHSLSVDLLASQGVTPQLTASQRCPQQSRQTEALFLWETWGHAFCPTQSQLVNPPQNSRVEALSPGGVVFGGGALVMGLGVL